MQQRRSEALRAVDEVQPLINQFNELSAEQQAVFLDIVAPLPDAEEAPKAKKTRKKRVTGASKRTSGMAAALNRSLDQSRAASAGDASSITVDTFESCADCPRPFDNDIHHKQSTAGYHEFKSAA